MRFKSGKIGKIKKTIEGFTKTTSQFLLNA